MDDNDAIEIKDRLNAIEGKQSNYDNIHQELISFSNHLNGDLQHITNHINNQTEILNAITNKLSRTIDSIDEKLQVKIMEDEIIFSDHVRSYCKPETRHYIG